LNVIQGFTLIAFFSTAPKSFTMVIGERGAVSLMDARSKVDVYVYVPPPVPNTMELEFPNYESYDEDWF
jgi:hypothetical protein